MNARDQSKPSANASLDEECQGRGLRILGKIIARDLAKRHRGDEGKMCKRKTDDDSLISGDDV